MSGHALACERPDSRRRRPCFCGRRHYTTTVKVSCGASNCDEAHEFRPSEARLYEQPCTGCGRFIFSESDSPICCDCRTRKVHA